MSEQIRKTNAEVKGLVIREGQYLTFSLGREEDGWSGSLTDVVVFDRSKNIFWGRGNRR